ncbi:uncharacterized protein ASCRUDRAFT_112025 [Ascoidea rubescens DSM 1968]|uniref:Uncharacterized protein n=1 Tax=Ascoidea rubescens DSM 1968 TaxID=1344418 RepID=A0A1D2VCL0_9ASCO|nr:hypothetical protein ASCRUDRAFT_112025 [Ascoidea rubescens DSM 1968]ODV59371.1 hypothetical protein ASCRUDRAFT_112025 [Ascoidea rubescens DSM 1968]
MLLADMQCACASVVNCALSRAQCTHMRLYCLCVLDAHPPYQECSHNHFRGFRSLLGRFVASSKTCIKSLKNHRKKVKKKTHYISLVYFVIIFHY